MMSMQNLRNNLNELLQIYVDDQLCGTIVYIPGKTSYNVSCNSKVGSGVKLSTSGELVLLMLCEVVAFGYLSGLQLFDLIIFILIALSSVPKLGTSK